MIIPVQHNITVSVYTYNHEWTEEDKLSYILAVADKVPGEGYNRFYPVSQLEVTQMLQDQAHLKQMFNLLYAVMSTRLRERERVAKIDTEKTWLHRTVKQTEKFVT